MSNKEIKTQNLLISNYYRFVENSDSVFFDEDYISLIYANNGSGKTTFAEEIYKSNKEDFYFLNLDQNVQCVKESNKMLISKNISLINELEKEINEICKEISDTSKEIICDIFNYSTGRENTWKKYVLPFFENEGIFKKLSLIVGSKDNNKKLYLTFRQINEIHDELIKYTFNEEENNNNTFNLEENSSYNELYVLKNDILSDLEKIDVEIQKKIIKDYEKQDIDIHILTTIFDSIKNLDEMKECYICLTKIENFSNIKKNIEDRINTLKEQFLDIFELENKFKKWDNFFNSKTLESYKLLNLNQLKNIINSSFKNFQNFLLQIAKIFYQNFCLNTQNSKKISKINSLSLEIDKLKKERKLNVIKNEDFLIIKKILTNILGEDRIEFNFTDDSKQFIDIKNMDEKFPFSTGEARLISFAFSLMFFISSINDNKKIVILDDTEDSLDGLNRINFIYILKTFFTDYKVKFLLLTHNNILIKEMWDQGIKQINVFLLYKTINDERKIVNIKNNNVEISYLSFSSGINLLRKTIVKNSDKLSVNEKIILFLYFSWLIRIKYLIWDFENSNNEVIINFLKYKNLFSTSEETKKDFEIVLKIVNGFFNNKNIFNFTFNKFNKFVSEIKDNILNLHLNNNIFPKIIANNIVNLSKILILREDLKKNIYDLCHRNGIDINQKDDAIWILLKKLNENNIITLQKRKTFNYFWNFFSSFYHNEISPSLLLNGIELNDIILDKLILELKKEY